ncbi:hypothetical protein RvY_00359, partial [Ramazzottius varieornatus]
LFVVLDNLTCKPKAVRYGGNKRSFCRKQFCQISGWYVADFSVRQFNVGKIFWLSFLNRERVTVVFHDITRYPFLLFKVSEFSLSLGMQDPRFLTSICGHCWDKSPPGYVLSQGFPK